MAINLPKQPTGQQFEEAVAARIRSIGYFTENRTILDFEGRSILELDVVASPASDLFLNRTLIDAKKEAAGFSDIFKIYGWRTFLKIPRGCIVHGVAMDARASAALKEVCPKLEVHANHFDITAPAPFEAIPVINGSADEHLRQTVSSIGWYQLIAERLALEDFYKAQKVTPDDPLFARVRKYRRACHLAFFESSPLKRVELLYGAFKEDPGISDACVVWNAKQSGKKEEDIWNAVRDEEFPWIQHVLALETRARMLIIKNGIEASLMGESAFIFLPKNFRFGFAEASKNPHRVRIPFILQIYFEVFGGFIVDETDRSQIASIAGTPVETVNEALNLFDEFFPTSKGWRFKSKEIEMTKMMPGYLHGIGAFFRHDARKIEKYSAVAPNQGWLISNWHNAVYKLLEKELAVKEAPAK